MKNKPLLIVVVLTFFSNTFFAQNIIDAQKINGTVKLDGLLDEAAWDGLERLPYKMQIPNFGSEPTEKNEIYLAYDEDYLYFAGRLYLSDSSYYRETTYKRDAFDGTADYFGLVIDSYNDNENAMAFFTGQTGFRWDGVVWNDAQPALDGNPLSGSPMSIDWNTFWDVATKKTDFGWSAEMRIPWSSLRFQDDNGKVVMGITSWWYIAAKNEVDMYPAIPQNWGDMSAFKPSQSQEFRFEGLTSKKPLYIAPYLLGGLQTNHDLNEEETLYEKDNDPTYEAGLDLKYGITSNLTLDLTLNTDFAQVEADDQQVNLTRFSLFFPEKRLFFQERASIFDFNFEGFNRLFYSRTIGINEDEPVRIYGGGRLVGRLGKADLGFLNMQTAANGDLNSENFSVLRLRRQVINPNTYIGGIFSNRTDFGGNYSTNYGVDGIFRLFGDEYFTVKFAQSFENDLENKPLSLNPTRIFANWERRRYDGLSYRLSFSQAGRDYNPGMGFELREDFSSLQTRIAYGILPKDESKILTLQFFLEGYGLQNNTLEKIETGTLTGGMNMTTKAGWLLNASVIQSHEFVKEAFELSDDVEVPIGDYDFTQFSLTGSTPFQHLFGTFVIAQVGGFFDGNLASIALLPRFKLSAHMDFELFYQYNRANFKDRNHEFTAHLARVKALYMLNTKFSVAAFLQYNSLDEVYTGNVRLRFNPKEGNDLYIVYNELLNSNRERELPHLPFSSSRAVVLKYTYTFGF